jgi:PAS domain S-box-containing protein
VNYKNLVNEIINGILVLDDQGCFEFVNKGFEQITGYAETEILFRPFSLLNATANQLSDSKLDWLNCLNPSSQETLHRRLFITQKNGNKIPVLISGQWKAEEGKNLRATLCIMDISNFTTCGIIDNDERNHLFRLVGKSQKMQLVYDQIEMTAKTNVSVIILGESGTGKELVASAIHLLSQRRKKPFVRVNCASLTETLLESELFGHIKGAFTGAYADRIGRFEEAHSGTLFLDEVGEISPSVQVKLLRVLQERIIVRVGDNRERAVDVRIISATHRNLRHMISKNQFREDLFYRLNVFPITLSPLRERKNDLPILCDHFVQKFNHSTGKLIHKISEDTMRIVFHYCWPGNVRELENAIEHAFVVCKSSEIRLEDFPEDIRESVRRNTICSDVETDPSPIEPHPTIMNKVIKNGGRLNISMADLISVLKIHNNNKKETAETLGISTVALWKKMKKFNF